MSAVRRDVSAWGLAPCRLVCSAHSADTVATSTAAAEGARRRVACLAAFPARGELTPTRPPCEPSLTLL